MKRKNVYVSGIFAVGFIISLLVFFLAQAAHKKDLGLYFDIATEERKALFLDRINLNLKYIEAASGFYYASSFVDRFEFNTFINSIIKEHKMAEAMFWAPLIARDNREDYELQVKNEGFQDFRIQDKDGIRIDDQNDRERFYPLTYIEPHNRYKSMLGYDLGSNSKQYQALIKSRDENKPVFIKTNNYFKEWFSESAYIAVLPIYRKNKIYANTQNNLENLGGYLALVLNLSNIFNNSMATINPQGIHTNITDVTANEKPQIVHKHISRLSSNLKGGEFTKNSHDSNSKNFVRVVNLNVGERQFQMKFETADEFFSGRPNTHAYVSLVIGWLITLIVGFQFMREFEKADIIDKRVKERTAELNKTKGELEKTVSIIAAQKDVLEKTKKATMNILEDLEDSKSNLETTNLDLAEQKRDLEKVNLELDRFTYTASHDLRAPLRAISSFSSFLIEDYGDKLDDEGKDYIKEISNGANRMTRLIDDLLSLSRISRIKNPYELVQMNDLVDSILERIDYDVKENNVDLIIHSNLPSVVCDRIKMGEVILNLINNAIKFSSKDNKDRPRVEMGGRQMDGGYEFYVTDNGIGIDPQFHDQVFALFRRLQKERDYEGTGAGLSIVKRIIDDHGGRIWIESELGEGTTFRFFIPDTLTINEVNDDAPDSSDVPGYKGDI